MIKNSYARILTDDFYKKCPKEVLAAISVSFSMLIDDPENAGDWEKAIIREWDILHRNGIIRQKPPTK